MRHSSAGDNGEAPRPNWSIRRGVPTLVTVAVCVGLVIVIVGVVASRRPAEGPTYPAGLTGVVPAEGAQAPRNSAVGVRLSGVYEPTSFTIEGMPVALDELDAGTTQLGEYFFIAGEGKSIERLQPGPACAEIRAHANVDAQLPDVEFRWCFNLV